MNSKLIFILTLSWLMLLNTSHADDFKVLSRSEVDQVIKRLPAHITLIQPYLMDDSIQWKLHKGDLKLNDSFNNSEALIVDGSLTIDGNYDDYSPGIGMLIVLGNMHAQNIISWGSIAVSGTIFAKELIYAYYNDFTFEASAVESLALVIFDRSNSFNKKKTQLFLSSEELQDEKTMEQALQLFEPRVLVEDLKEMIGEELTSIFPSYDLSKELLSKKSSVFRSKKPSIKMLPLLKKALATDTPLTELYPIASQDKLFNYLISLRNDVSDDFLIQNLKSNDPFFASLIISKEELSPRLLQQLLENSNSSIRIQLAQRDKLSPDIVQKLFHDPDKAVRDQVIIRGYAGQLSRADIETILSEQNPTIVSRILIDTGVSLRKDDVLKLSTLKNPEVQEAIGTFIAAEALWQRLPVFSNEERSIVARALLNDDKTKENALIALDTKSQEDLLKGAQGEIHSQLLYVLAASSRSGLVHREIAQSNNHDLKVRLADNPWLDRDIQLLLISQLEPVASRRRLSMFDSEGMSKALEGQENVVDSLLNNPHLSSEALQSATSYCESTSGNAIFCNTLLDRNDLTPEILNALKEKLVGESREDLALSILRQPLATQQLIEWAVPKWYDDEDELLKEFNRISKNNHGDEFWIGLAKSSSDKLREIAAYNEHTPNAILSLLVQEKNIDIAGPASQNRSLDVSIVMQLPLNASLWSINHPKISRERVLAMYEWALSNREHSLLSECLKQLSRFAR